MYLITSNFKLYFHFSRLCHLVGVIASMCLGIYPNNDFKGVVCVDITISDVLGAATFFRPTEASYAFIVDDRGRLMTHPLLPRPRDYTHDPIFVDMLTIENEREAKEILSAMLRYCTFGHLHGACISTDIIVCY